MDSLQDGQFLLNLEINNSLDFVQPYFVPEWKVEK